MSAHDARVTACANCRNGWRSAGESSPKIVPADSRQVVASSYERSVSASTTSTSPSTWASESDCSRRGLAPKYVEERAIDFQLPRHSRSPWRAHASISPAGICSSTSGEALRKAAAITEERSESVIATPTQSISPSKDSCSTSPGLARKYSAAASQERSEWLASAMPASAQRSSSAPLRRASSAAAPAPKSSGKDAPKPRSSAA